MKYLNFTFFFFYLILSYLENFKLYLWLTLCLPAVLLQTAGTMKASEQGGDRTT